MADAASGHLSRTIPSVVAGGNVVLFCGAGISVEPPATLPDWKTFRDETVKAVASADASLASYVDALVGQDLIGGQALAPELVASQARGVVPDFFESLTALDHGQPNRNHALVGRLVSGGFIRHVVTTNFDQLIEESLSVSAGNVRVYRSDADFAAFDPAAVGVLKLHGCLSEPDTIVATVEQEAVGLSPPKSAVLRDLLTEHPVVFWGYSGADLKLDLDYLQMVTAAPSSPGFLWNLHATPTWKEPPNRYVDELVELYGDRASVWHEELCDALAPVVGVKPEPPEAEDVDDLRTRRGAQLSRALQEWAGRSVRPEHAFEIFGRLFERTGEVQPALECYQLLADRGFAEHKRALTALAYARGGDLLSRMGQFEQADDALRLADDHARSAGALDLDLMVARTRGRLFSMQGRLLPAVQPLGFGRLVSTWATSSVAAATLGLELDMSDRLVAQGLVDGAMRLIRAAERDARAGGRLEQVAEALDRRSRVHERLGEWSEAVTCAREACDIAFSLGLAGDVRLFGFRIARLEAAAGSDAALAAPHDLLDAADRARNQRLASELILDTLETTDVDPEQALEWVSRVASYVEGGGSHLAVRLAAAWSRVYQQTGRAQDEIEAITGVLVQLAHVGNELPAGALHERLAQAQSKTGRSSVEVLHSLEAAAHVTRRSKRFSPRIEDALAQLRREQQGARWPADWRAFVDRWAADLTALPDVLEVLADWAGAGDADLGEQLVAERGSDGRYVWCIWSTAALCRQLRLDGRAETALEVMRGCLPLARELGDAQLEGVLHNECGFDLMLLGRPEEAREEFQRSIDACDAAGDTVGLLDGLFNAASACARVNRHAEAIELYDRMQRMVVVRQDLKAALGVALSLGELLKALGNDVDAVSHFEAAEYFARAVGDERKLELIAIRLGKLYWNRGEYEHSIRYRLQVMRDQERNGAAAGVAQFALLVASTYDKQLNRPRDALPFYRRTLSLAESVDAGLDQAGLQQMLADCEARARAVEGQPSLYELLIDTTGSEQAAERIAARMALSVDFNLWRFELRSFAAWYERTFSAPEPEDAWLLVAVTGLCELGKAARHLHDPDQATAFFSVAEGIANAAELPQLRDMVRSESVVG